MEDEEVIPFLLTLRRPAPFTRDLGLYDRSLCHARYCLITLAVGQYEVAHFIRRVLRHQDFNTQAKRMGSIIRGMHTGLVAWRLHSNQSFGCHGLVDLWRQRRCVGSKSLAH
jgi:hypothetical protein